ncbi:MAG: proteasome assembly chaperone family protein [Thermoprotei archaeon]|nr:proteasome assembly chaperone family protein [Thermoprotei archaeon]
MYYVEEYNGFTIYETKEFKLEHPSFMLLGLPDTGLVASISSSYLVDALKMEEVGGIDSYRYFPPIAVIHNGESKMPIRIFHRKNLLVIISELPISPGAIHPLAFMLVDYAQKKGVTHIVSPIGLGVPHRMEVEKPAIYGLSTSKDGSELLSKFGVKKFQEGFIVGPYAVILKEAKRRKVSNIVIFAEAFIDFPDPAAAVEVLTILTKIFNVEVNLKPLIEKAEEIRLKTRELMMNTKKVMERMRKGYEQQLPLMYVF